MDVAHDGTFFVQEGIQQGGLTGVCFADDSHGHSVLQGIAHAERIYQVMDNLLNLTGDIFQFRTVGKLQFFVVAEVEFQFHKGSEVEQFVAQDSQFTTESATHLVHGHAVGSGRSGCNEVGHGFGLAQVHLAIQEGTLGVFTRSGGTASLTDEKLHHLLKDVARSVAGDFRGILASIRVGGTEKADQHFVDDFSFGREDMTEGEGIRCAFG